MTSMTSVDPHDLRPSGWAQLTTLSRRAILGSTRQLPLLVPSMMFPLFFVAINSSSFQKSLPLLRANGYPKLDSFLTFTLAATVVQGVLFGSVQGATDLATDIEGGFFERMIAAPARRVTILISRLAGGVAIGVVQAVLFTVLLVLFGASVASGVPGVVVVVISASLLGLAFGALMAAVAIKSGSAEVVQSSFPIVWGTGLAYRFKSMAAAPLMQIGVFVLVFLSATQVPMEGLTGWLKVIARINPATNILRLGRQGFLGSVTWHDTWPGLLSIAGFSVAAGLFSYRGLRKL